MNFDKDFFMKNKYSIIALFFILILLLVFSNTNQKKYDSLIITEVCSSNKGNYADIDGNTYDWVELYNNSNEDVNLSDYTISDKLTNKSIKFPFGGILKSKEYIVLSLSNTNFLLTGEDKLRLINKKSETIDSVSILNMGKNNSMALINDKWVITDKVSPGYENTDEGYEKYISSLNEDNRNLIINEILPVNHGIVNFNGRLDGYVELYNNSNEVINLNEYSLSNDINLPFMWKLPNTTLNPNEVYLIYTNEFDKDNNASFKLEKNTGVVVLSHLNKIVDKVEYSNIPNGVAYINENNKFIESVSITPGYLNTSRNEFINSLSIDSKLIINEVMSSNNSYLLQNGGQYYDWIELYNDSDSDINLSDYYLSNDKNNKVMYKLPDTIIKAKSYYVVMASGDESLSNSNYYHTNFKISSVEGLYLFKDNKLLDSVFIYNLPLNYSYGRYHYYKTPTPNKKNIDSNIIDISYNPNFSIESGIYSDSSMSIKINSNGTVYYTLDGSNPSNMSNKYVDDINISKTTTIKAISYEVGKKESDIVTNTYILNNENLPVVSISLNSSEFNRINNNPYTTVSAKAHFDYLDDETNISIDCGIKVFGGESRTMNKKSYSLKFNSEYDGVLKYKMFDNRDAIEYNNLVLRSGSQDITGLMFKDEYVSSIISDYGTVDVQAYKPVSLYVNGKYWGLYYIREKVNDEFIVHHYNVKEGNTNIVKITNEVTDGTITDYRNLVNYIRNHDMKNEDNYNHVKELLDIDSFIDYWIILSFFNNYDVGNTKFFNNINVDNGKIKMIAYDFDYSIYDYPNNYFSWMTEPGGMGYYLRDNSIMRGLLNNNNFVNRFIERLKYYYNEVFTEEHLLNNYEKFVLLKDEIKKDSERWNYSYSNWEKNVESKRTWLKNRKSKAISNVKSFFKLSSEEVNEYFK